MEAPTQQSRRTLLGLSVPLGIVLSGLFVWQASHAAFTATTVNEANQWAAGVVVLTDDSADTAMFNVDKLKPGDTGERCIEVTYEGTVDADVRLHVGADGLTGDLGPYLDITVEQGTGGTFDDCSGFTGDSLYTDGTLAGFAAGHTDFGSGVGNWAPTGASVQSRTYRFTYELQGDNAAQGKDATATFTWEAQSS
jgi:hypothetical protein